MSKAVRRAHDPDVHVYAWPSRARARPMNHHFRGFMAPPPFLLKAQTTILTRSSHEAWRPPQCNCGGKESTESAPKRGDKTQTIPVLVCG